MSRRSYDGNSCAVERVSSAVECTPTCDESNGAVVKVRVSYAGECSLEEAVSRFLAMRENVRDADGGDLP